MKSLLFYLSIAGSYSLLALLFGYFDIDLAEERRWIGLGLILVGIATMLPAGRRLIEDWPRMKPRHNVDLAFVQIGFGVVVLCIACLMGGRAAAFFAPLTEPTPKPIAPPNQRESLRD